MAVNDLMMKIQLLVESGKSTSELNRLQKSLENLQGQLNDLGQHRLAPLAQDLDLIKKSISGLRTVSLNNFTQTLDGLKKSFSGLGANTKSLDDLLSAYKRLSNQLNSGASSNYLNDILRLQSEIRKIRTDELIPLGNEIRKLNSQKGLDKALKVDGLAAQIRVDRAEIRYLKNEIAKIPAAFDFSSGKRIAIDPNQQGILDNYINKVKSLNESIIKNDLDVARRNKSIVDQYNTAIAQKKVDLDVSRNALDTKQNELKNARELLKIETEKEKSIRRQIKELSGIATSDVKAKLASLNVDLSSVKSRKSDLEEQVKKTGQLVNLETSRINALERSGRLFGVFVTQHRALQNTIRDLNQQYQEIVNKISAFSSKSESAKNAIIQMKDGGLSKLNEQLSVSNNQLTNSKTQLKGLFDEYRSRLPGVLTDLRKYRSELENVKKEIIRSGGSVLGNSVQIPYDRLDLLDRFNNLNSIIKSNQELLSLERKLHGERTKGITDEIRLLSSSTAVLQQNINAIKSKNAAFSNIGNVGDANNKIKEIIGQLRQLYNQRGISSISQVLSVDRNTQSVIDQLNAMRELRKAYRDIEIATNKIQPLKEKAGSLDASIKSAKQYAAELSVINRFKQGFGFMLTPEMLGMSAFSMVIGLLGNLKDKFIEINSFSETTIRGLSAVFGKGLGDIKFDQLISTANKYGLEIKDLSRNYLQLSASTKGTMLEGQRTEDIFQSLSAAMAVLGADTMTTQRAFRAVGQMISKGQVYAEELKGQLAEALPGAIQLFARSMGKTTQEFLAMVKTGQVGLNELIPFFREVQKEYANTALESTTYEQATNRLSNAWTGLLKVVGDPGVWRAVVVSIDSVAGAIQGIVDLLKKDPFEELKNLENLKVNILSEDDFNKLDEITNKIVKFKITNIGLFNANDYEAYIKAAQESNKLIQERIDLFQKSKINFDIEDTRNQIFTIEKEIKSILSRDQYEIKLKANLSINNLPDANTSEVNSGYSNYIKQYSNQIERLTSLRSKLTQLLSQQSDNSSEERKLLLTKQQLGYEKALLDLQQRSEYAIQSIVSAQATRELKARGIADSVVTEYTQVQALMRAYQTLAKVAEFEQRVNSTESVDAQNQIRTLQLDQLRYAETVARSANNQNLLLSILKQQQFVQEQISQKQFIDLSKVNNTELTDQIKQQEELLRKSLKSGSSIVVDIYKAIGANQQLNELLKTQSALTVRVAQQEREVARSFKEAKDQAEANAKAIKKSQEDQGGFLTPEYEAAYKKRLYAQESLSVAEEAFAKLRKSNNEKEIEELKKVVEANLNVARTSFIDAGYSYGVDKVKTLSTSVQDYEKSVNQAAIAQQKLTLESIVKASTPEEFKRLFDQLNQDMQNQIKVKEDALAKTQGLTGAEKQAYQDLADKAEREFKRLSDARDLALKNYETGVKTGSISELDKQINLDIKDEKAKGKIEGFIKWVNEENNAFVNTNAELKNAIESVNGFIQWVNKQSASIQVNTNTYQGQSPPSGKRWGGFISGYGGGDRIRALLEPGEFVMRKEAVRALGIEQLYRLNRLGSQAKSSLLNNLSIPRFANGGGVSGQPIIINVPGSKAIALSGSRDAALQLANLLTRTGRAL